jgi:small GTP-binding protein
MTTVAQAKEYAELVIEYVKLRQKKLSAKSKKKLAAFEGNLGGDLASLLSNNQALAEFALGLITQKEHQSVREEIIGALLTEEDTDEEATKKLKRLRSFVQKKDRILLTNICLIGDEGVGKTKLMLAIQNHDYKDSEEHTIGVGFGTKLIQRGVNFVKLKIRDAAGAVRYRGLLSTYMMNCSSVMVVYDVTNQASFDHLNEFADLVGENLPANVNIILVGTKTDLANERVVDVAAAQAFAKKNGWQFMETSSKTHHNIDQLFEGAAQYAVEHPEFEEAPSEDKLTSLLMDKAWHQVTSKGAGSPAGFKIILKAMEKNPNLSSSDLLDLIKNTADTRAKSAVSKRPFFNKRDPQLVTLYSQLKNADSMDSVMRILQKGLQDVKREQEELKITKGPFSQ